MLGSQFWGAHCFVQNLFDKDLKNESTGNKNMYSHVDQIETETQD